MVSSFFVGSVFDTAAGILVFVYALTQGLLPKPPELPDLPAFDIAFWAQHPSFLLFTITALGIGIVVAFALLARRVEAFWDRVKQGAVVLTDPRRYLRTVASWQAAGWLLRFFSFWFFLEAFHIGGSFQNVLLVMSVQAVSTMLPLTPGGAGAQQALLVATLVGPGPIAVLTYSVGQQIAVAVWTAILGAWPSSSSFAPPTGAACSAARTGRRSSTRPRPPGGADSPAPGRLLARREQVVVPASEGLERDQRRIVLEAQPEAETRRRSPPRRRSARSAPSPDPAGRASR